MGSAGNGDLGLAREKIRLTQTGRDGVRVLAKYGVYHDGVHHDGVVGDGGHCRRAGIRDNCFQASTKLYQWNEVH